PNVILEAWAAGIPVLSFDLDPDGVIEREQAGVVAGGDAAAIAPGARSLLKSPEERRRLGLNGHRYIKSAHDPQLILDHWENLARSLASPKANPPGPPRG